MTGKIIDGITGVGGTPAEHFIGLLEPGLDFTPHNDPKKAVNAYVIYGPAARLVVTVDGQKKTIEGREGSLTIFDANYINLSTQSGPVQFAYLLNMPVLREG